MPETGRTDLQTIPNRIGRIQPMTLVIIHPAVNIGLLEQYWGKNPDWEVGEKEAEDTGWKMERIITNSSSENDKSNHACVGNWERSSHDENTWESFHNVNENAEESLNDYYVENLQMDKEKRFGKKKLRKH